MKAWAKKYKSANRMKIVIPQIFDHAILLKLIKENPMRIIKMPKKLVVNNDTGKFYDKEELRLFFKAANEHGDELLETFLRLLAMTGMRKSEELALCWNDIDFKEKTLNITKSVTLDENRQSFISTPKTEPSIRIISVDPDTLQHLQKWKINQARYFLQRGIIVNKSNQHIFTNIRNELFHPPTPNKVLDDIISSGQLKRMTVHGFRHTHAILLFEIDTPIHVVQEHLGHKEIARTMDIYAHVIVKKQDEYADKFAEYMNF